MTVRRAVEPHSEKPFEVWVPGALHDRLKAHALLTGVSISDTFVRLVTEFIHGTGREEMIAAASGIEASDGRSSQ